MWKKLPDLPTEIVNHQTAYLNASIYVFGGSKKSRPLNSDKISIFKYSSGNQCKKLENIPTLSYSVKSKKIEIITDKEPYDCFGHTCVEWCNSVILFGGYNGGNVCTDNVYLYTPSCVKRNLLCNVNLKQYYDLSGFKSVDDNGVWLKLLDITGEVPEKRDGHAVVIYKNAMYLFGGLISGYENFYDNKLFKLDLETWNWTILFNGDHIEPLARDFTSLGTYNDALYVFGGRSFDVDKGDVYDTALWKFDLKTRNQQKRLWTKVHPGKGIITWTKPIFTEEFNEEPFIEDSTKLCPFPRRSQVATVCDSHLFIFGGLFDTDQFSIHYNDTWRFNFLDNTWYNCDRLDAVHFISESEDDLSVKPWPNRRCSLTQINSNQCYVVTGGISASTSSLFQPEITYIHGETISLESNLILQNYDTIFFESINRKQLQQPLTSLPLNSRDSIILYRSDSPQFNGSICSRNDLHLRPLNQVYLYQPITNLYQLALCNFSKKNIESHLLDIPTKLRYDLFILKQFD